MLLLSCEDKVLHEFRSVKDGWRRGDTLQFCLYEASERAYSARIELRSDAGYSYRDVFLGVEVVAYDGSLLSSDSIVCPVYDDYGAHEGVTSGLLYQSHSAEFCLPVICDDSLHIRIYHIMNDSVLKGINDVGIRLLRCGRRQFSEN